MRYFDTATCIDILRGRLPHAHEMLENSDPEMFAVPAIVAAELYLAVQNSSDPLRSRVEVDRFLMPFDIVPFDERCAHAYARLDRCMDHRGDEASVNDMLAAATALANDGVLITHNHALAQHVPGLQVESWMKVEV